MNDLASLIDTAASLELSRYSGLTTTAVVALALVVWTFRLLWRGGKAAVLWAIPKRSEVLQAALDCLTQDAAWDGQTLLAGPLTVYKPNGLHGDIHDAKAGGCDLRVSLSTGEMYTLSAHVKRKIRQIEAAQLAERRMLAATALRGGSLPICTRRIA